MTAPADTPDPLIGALLHGKYRLVRRIGKGGFGTVYEAHDERGAGNRVAIKVLKKEFSSDARLVRAFRAEARRMTRLSHPNIVDWKNFDADPDGTCYFVMELVEGEELDRVLARKRPLPPDRAANILLQILDALRAAHHLAEGGSVLHLDLKPRNVFVLPARAGRPEQVKVIDFGIGQHIGEEADEGPALPGEPHKLETSALPDFNPTTLRFQDATVHDPPGLRRCQGCTPEYVSPEQAAHVLGMPDVVQLDGRSDIYSLGVIAYQMLTGDLPFSRPVMRTDYLRLHISGQPRKIAAARAKVPRALARFVERCLQKDREDRFQDAREAHAVMERIVRPSRALKVAAATLILAGAAFGFGGYLMRGGARAEVLASAGAELGPQTPLFLGPERRSAVLQMRTSGLVESGSSIALVRASDGGEVPGSHVTLTAPDGLRLELSQDPGEGRSPLAVRVEAQGARFAPFELVWLGPRAWSLHSVRAGATDLAAATGPDGATEPGRTENPSGAPHAIDPFGLSLEVALAGAGRDDVVRLSARPEDGDEVELVPSGVQGEQRLFRADFSLLRLRAGPARIALRAEDRAGGSRSLDLPLLVVDGALAAGADLCKPGADGACARFNQMNGRFLLSPASKTLLRVTPSRSARIDWRIRLEGDSGEPSWNQAPAAARHEIPIELPPATGDEVRTGEIELRLDESGLVVRAESTQRGLLPLSLPFLVSSELADFSASLELADGSSAGSPGGTRMPLAEDRTTWVSGGKLSLVVERRGRPAMSLRLGDGRSAILRAGQQELRFPLDAGADGERTLEIQSYRFDTAEQSLADEPDTKRAFRIGVDTIPPAFAATSGVDGSDFRDPFSMPEHMTPETPSRDAGAPVHLDWRLAREPDGLERRGTWTAEKAPLPLRRFWTAKDALPDGAWRLELSAADEAGNSAPAVVARFRVAFSGPEVAFEAPRPGTWQPDPEGWLVQVRVRDPNGVEGAACAIVSEDGTRVPVELSPGAGTAEDRELRGHATIPHEWSSRAVRLEVEARDGAGQHESAVLGGLALPNIDPPRPPAVRSAGARGGRGPVMRLVPGNAGAQYLFGGRGDDVENAAHKGAGLRSFSQQSSLSGAPRSWSIPCAAEEIHDFYLDEREVTRGEFLAFARDPSGYADPSHRPAGAELPTAARRAELIAKLASDPDLPVAGVTWEEALAFAHWIGRRLPTWIELEYAARGGPSSYRPFASFAGAPPAAGQINAKGLGPGHAWAAGTGSDVTPDTGIRDLAGNVAEWTSTPLVLPGDPETGDRAAYFRAKRAEMLSGESDGSCAKYWIAGGSFREENYFFETAAARPRGFVADHLGFRCALSIEAVRAGLDRHEMEDVR